MKYQHLDLRACVRGSRPARGAWIEMPLEVKIPTRGWSRPARGAWIEI